MNTMRVARFGIRAEAEAIQRRLEEAGIAAEVDDELGLQALWFVSKRAVGARLKVPTDYFERAQKMVAEWDAQEGGLPGVVRCPECNSLRVDYPQFTRNSIINNLALGIAAKIGVVEKKYYCEDCHYTWSRDPNRWPRPGRHSAPNFFIEGR